jgi:aspartate/methionine/tyrosine aminotransferase
VANCLILQPGFKTSIYEILESVNKDTFFISDWNKENDILDFNVNQFQIKNEYHKNKNTYFFSDEFQEIKKKYAPYVLCQNTYKCILPDDFAIVSNCTIGGFLSLYYINQCFSKINALILAPTYFSYIRILQDMGANIHYIECYNSDDNKIIKEINDSIHTNSINIIIATEPLFGTGVSLSEKIFLEINNICESNNIYFLIDYTYGGMKWNEYNCEQDSFFINLAKSKYTILIESICKRVFLNGIKHGIVMANPQIIKKIEELSVYIAGCLSEQQILLYKQLYAITNRKYISETINRNNTHYESNFALVNTLLVNSHFDISLCNCGYFCLIGIPKHVHNENISIAKNILQTTNILTIPHDRYIFNCEKYYYFRVNLAISSEKLIPALQLLLQTYFNGIN